MSPRPDDSPIVKNSLLTKDRPALVTGATGLLGSHIAERLVKSGRPVRALVRLSSDTEFLESIGVELIRGDLTDFNSCLAAVQGADQVYHCAAKVGDWGTWEEFQTSCLEATDNLAKAAKEADVRRFLHISSTSAYGHPQDPGYPIDETHPLGVGLWWPWDYYTRSKVDCERILWRWSEVEGLPLTIIRPSWLYGERDRTTVARLVGRLRRGGIPSIGKGDNPLSAVYAGNVADAAILAADDPSSNGEAYNITDQGRISQRDFLNLFAEVSGASKVRQRLPYGLVFTAGFVLEGFGRLTRRRKAPLITRYATWLMGRTLSYSTAKARQELGWSPALDYRESIERAVGWYLEDKSPRLAEPRVNDSIARH